jgi:hypothetical protein
MVAKLRIALLALVLALVAPGLARAAGGTYVFASGTPREQAQVHAALEASSFDWSLVPQTITIHIDRGHESDATQGSIWLDADLVDAGQFAWGTIQHEYAHQVDFFLLDDAKRGDGAGAVPRAAPAHARRAGRAGGPHRRLAHASSRQRGLRTSRPLGRQCSEATGTGTISIIPVQSGSSARTARNARSACSRER